MKSFREFVNITLNEDTDKNPWNDLVNHHRVQFNDKFDNNSISTSDRNFLITLFDHYKLLQQQKDLNIFKTKISGVTISFGYFQNQLWAVCIETDKTREVTERFKITDIKINPMIEIFDKAIKTKTFKNLLPVTVK